MAFSLPFPNSLLIIVTPLILLWLAIYIATKPVLLNTFLGISLIIGGAISNFADRLLFGITVDYIRILTSVINLGDAMIVVGALLLVAKSNKKINPINKPLL